MMKLHQDEAYWSEDAELLVTTLNICAGHTVNKEEDILSPHEYQTLSKLTNKICRQLSQIQSIKVILYIYISAYIYIHKLFFYVCFVST